MARRRRCSHVSVERGSVIRSANRRAGSSSAPRVPASTSSRSGSHESPPRTDGGYAAEAALVLRLKSAGYVLGGIKASGGARPRTDDRENNGRGDRKSTRLNSSHQIISYAVFC